MASLAAGLKVYFEGRTYLVTTSNLIDVGGEGRLYVDDGGPLSDPMELASIGAHMPYSDWRPVAESDIPPRLLELLAQVEQAEAHAQH